MDAMNKNAMPETFSKQLTNGSHLARFTAKGRTKIPINAETALMTSPTSGALSSALMWSSSLRPILARRDKR
jgi:hypothetical protein